eukprot:TRINITY_DN2728_c0_g1_i1.p1 TRINITY_DN2728_c0_g1~~TRINITY_DN2728_c0_g1_i1.p1  ORF type:complete len:428 (+),score=56.07 TRINITY_DN2728_c0_g1_i1:153-1286(+)
MSSTRDRVKGAIYGALIADAIASPTHWFYGGHPQVVREYGGPITGYVKPNENLAGSIMNKSSTGGGGRGTFQGNIIGDVINHGKKHYWAPGENYHYHVGLEAGENTLEARLMLRAVHILGHGDKGVFDDNVMLQEYVRFMTTPGSHNDAYAATAHRMFFSNLKSGIDPQKCQDNDQHNVDSVDSLTLPIPVALFAKSDEQATADVRRAVGVIRKSPLSQEYMAHLTRLLRRVVGVDGEDVNLRSIVSEESLKAPANSNVKNISTHGPDPVTACYLSSSYPSSMFMIYKYGNFVVPTELEKVDENAGAAFREAVIANANRGGENVGQGAVIGAVVGAACGFRNIPKDLVDGLAAADVTLQASITEDIDAFLLSSTLVN